MYKFSRNVTIVYTILTVAGIVGLAWLYPVEMKQAGLTAAVVLLLMGLFGLINAVIKYKLTDEPRPSASRKAYRATNKNTGGPVTFTEMSEEEVAQIVGRLASNSGKPGSPGQATPNNFI